VTVQPQSGTAPTVTLSASPTTVNSGETTTLTWSSTNAASCTASGAWGGTKAMSGSQASVALTAASNTFTLTCSNSGGTTAAQSVTVGVRPTITLTASSTAVAFNGSSTLTWSTTNATSCTASNAWSGNKATSGSATLNNLTATGTYTLVCTGAGGSSSVSTTITVGGIPLPVVTFTANPASVEYQGSTTVSWSATDATSCTASGAWSGPKATSGTESLTSLTTSGTFTLTCTGGGGSAVSSVEITVAAAPAPALDFSADTTTVSQNGSVTLDWSASYADNCVASSTEDSSWSGNKPMKGTYKSKPLTKKGSFSLVCVGAGGVVTKSVVVSVDDGKTAGDASGGSGGGAGSDASATAANKKVGGGALNLWIMLAMLALAGYRARRHA
jgi:hypothetical protein